MEKVIKEKIIRSAFIAMKVENEKINVNNFEKALKEHLVYEYEEFIAYCVIAMHTLENSATKLEAKSIIMEIPAIQKVYTRNQALEKAKKLLNNSEKDNARK